MPGAGYEVVEEYVNQSKYNDEIVFGGFVTDEELVVLYSCCNVFCFVSLYEGFGIPPLEALACGAKVVVSNTSALPEVVGNLGWKVNPHSLDEIEAAVNEALNTPVDENYKKSVAVHLKDYEWSNLGKYFEKTICM